MDTFTTRIDTTEVSALAEWHEWKATLFAAMNGEEEEARRYHQGRARFWRIVLASHGGFPAHEEPKQWGPEVPALAYQGPSEVGEAFPECDDACKAQHPVPQVADLTPQEKAARYFGQIGPQAQPEAEQACTCCTKPELH